MTPIPRTPRPRPAALLRDRPESPDDAALSGVAEQPGPFWAKITGQAAGTNRYAWTQIDEGDTAAFDTGLSDGFAATGTSAVEGAPAYEVNGRQTVPVGARVKLWPAGDLTYYVFAAPGIAGGGTTTYLPIWADATTLGDSKWRQTDSTGVATVNDVALSALFLGPGYATAGQHYVQLQSGSVIPYLTLSRGNFTDPQSVTFGLSPANAATPAGYFITLTHDRPFTFNGGGFFPTLAVCDGTAANVKLGLTGGIGPGATVSGGLVVGLGSGSFVTLSGNNTWTGTNSFTGAVTVHPATDVSPLVLQGGGAGAADILDLKTAGGATVLSVTGAGNVTLGGNLSVAGVLSGAAFTGLQVANFRNFF